MNVALYSVWCILDALFLYMPPFYIPTIHYGISNSFIIGMNLSKCKTFSLANQIVRNEHSDEELELFHNITK